MGDSKMIKLKDILTEKKKFDQKYLNQVHKYTQSNNHTQARIFLTHMMKEKKLLKFYNAMRELNDVFGGYGPELSKLNQKMEKQLYIAIQKQFLNAEEIIGLL